MAKNSLKCKELMAKEISVGIDKAGMLVVTSYKGLTAQELNELRRELRNTSGDYLVVKNSIAKRALGASNASLASLLEGEVGIAIDRKKDPASFSKVLTKFSKDHESLKIHGGVMDGAAISKSDIKELALLPSKEVLLTKLANVLNAPICGLAISLKSIISKLVYALDAVKDRLPKEKVLDEVKKIEEQVKAPEAKEEPKEDKEAGEQPGSK